MSVVADKSKSEAGVDEAGLKPGPELLVDGGFEAQRVGKNAWSNFDTVGGWKSDTRVEVWGKDFYGVKATEGQQVAELDFDRRASNLYQDVTTEKGVEYAFSFDFAKRPDSKAGSDTIEVFWNGEKVGSFDPASTAWAKGEVKVVGTGGADRIEFREEASDNDSYGGLIDNASLRSTGRVEFEAAAEKAAAEKAAAEKAAAEKAAAEKAAAEKAAAEKAAAEKAAAEKAAAEKAGVDIHIGDGKLNGLSGWDNSDSIVFGEGGTDKISGLGGNDFLAGGGGDDTMSGDQGNDAMFGATTVGGKVDMTKMRIAEDATAKVTFNHESAGYKNALGVYKIAADGTVSGVKILFANASLKGSGGDLVAGVSAVDVPVKAGEQLGFFVVSNGFSQPGMAALLSDASATFKFVGADGKAGNVYGGKELKLVQVNAAGVETVVKSAYGTTVFHSVDDGTMGLNGDGMKHVVGTVNNLDGTVRVGFEDLKGGGDKDFDDSVFTVTLGTTNTALLAKEATKPARATDKDDMSGGDGDDKLFGMADDDRMDGGDGNDQMWGNSGNDVMAGGAGNDAVSGGKGDDTLDGGDGDDVVEGNTGDDVMVDGAGRDSYVGGAGYDTLDFSRATAGAVIDVSKGSAVVGGEKNALKTVERVLGTAFADEYKGSKDDDAFVGGDGDDRIRGLGGVDTLTGGGGKDTYVWMAKDIGSGADHITDFSKEDLIDLRDVLKGQKFSALGDVVKVSAGDKGTTVSVKMGDAFVDVVHLDGVNAPDLLASGLILS